MWLRPSYYTQLGAYLLNISALICLVDVFVFFPENIQNHLYLIEFPVSIKMAA